VGDARHEEHAQQHGAQDVPGQSGGEITTRSHAGLSLPVWQAAGQYNKYSNPRHKNKVLPYREGIFTAELAENAERKNKNSAFHLPRTQVPGFAFSAVDIYLLDLILALALE
jgi:hypothetical protein